MRELITIVENLQLPLAPTENNIQTAKDFVFNKWKERAKEMGRQEPLDLSYSCKFSSLFAQKIFGGKIQGNYDHQYLVLNGIIIDLNIDAEDVKALGKPYNHDPIFWNNKDHKKSMKSCIPRVDNWVKEFIKLYD